MINAHHGSGLIDKMNMLNGFEIRDFKNENDFNQCIELQKKIFSLSETDVLSPLYLKLIARNNPPVGISLGFFKENQLIGFMVGTATLLEKSLYVVFAGLDAAFHSKGIGRGIFLEFRKRALNNGIEQLYGIFEPLDTKLAYLYFSKLGFWGINYEKDVYALSNLVQEVPNDKVLFRWSLNSRNTISKINNKRERNINEHLKNIPIVSQNNLSDNSHILIKIPVEFDLSKKENYLVRIETRNLFCEYINSRKYFITDCISEIKNNKRQIYYLLEKQ